MGLNEKIIFLGILGIGAIVGVISFTIFSDLPPTPGNTKSIYRQDLPPPPPPTAQASSNTESKIDPATVKADVTLTILEGAATQGNPDYDPKELSVKKGNVIKVENLDPIPHTVTNGAGPNDPNSAKIFDTSLIMGGESGILQTEEIDAGEHPYYCTVHPYMTGTLKVE
ncbi:MAG TPA: plastocyanin/azurin family copper-binding protein [Nitrososphaeraceae archaeon]|nr:plastocyanin/azurin family copper-binding protein [Nitrososphaeraceae archaeon]